MSPERPQDQQSAQRAVYRLVKITRVLLVIALVGVVGLLTDCLFGLLQIGDACLAFPITVVAGVGALGVMAVTTLRVRAQSSTAVQDDDADPPDAPADPGRED